MARWSTWIGYCSLVAGLFFVSPLTDLLPVEMWSQHSSPWYRVVAAESGFAWLGPSLIATGCLLAGAGIMSRRRA